jgi:exopolysaccharide production protein ExoZ
MFKTGFEKRIAPQARVLTSPDGLPRHLNSLQWLRALAAVAVVYFHAALQVNHLSPASNVRAIGATGVDIFFVLSGFIMWITTRISNPGAVGFLVKRVERIVPLYWLLTLTVSTIALIVPNLLKSTHFNYLHIIASMFFIPWQNPAALPGTSELISPVIVPGWTLNMEMVFYVLFSVCLSLTKLWRVICISALIAGLYVVGLIGIACGSILSFYGNSVIFEFLFGVLLAAYLLPLLNFSAPVAWGLLGLSLIVLACVEGASVDLPRAIKYGVPAFFAIAAAVNLERIHAVPKISVLVKLGDASYSIYLSHIFILAGLRMTVGFLQANMSPWAGYIFIFVGVVASVSLGLLIHRFIEKPLSYLKVKVARRDSGPTRMASR